MKRELKTSDGQNLGWKCTEDWSVRCADVLCGFPEQCENSTWLYTTVFAVVLLHVVCGFLLVKRM